MPMYDYRCHDCGEVHEVFLRGAGDTPTTCPGCGGERLERLLSAFNVGSQPARVGSTTCCGRDSRCDSPPCSTGDVCRRS